MGMAASQARFLQLTARKNNDEYMGQQINQARTALANKSAGLFEKMLGLQPPTPPSSMDDKYYTQAYGFTDPRDEVRKKIVWTNPNAMEPEEEVASIIQPTYYNALGNSITATNITFPTGYDTDVVALDLAELETSSIIGALNPAPEGTVSTIIEYADISHTSYDPDGNYQTYTDQAPIIAYFDNEQRLLNFQELSITPAYNLYSSYNASSPPTTDTYYYDPGNATQPARNYFFDASAGTITATGVAGDAPESDAVDWDNVSVYAAESPITLAYERAEGGTGYSNKDLSYNGNFNDVLFQQDMDKYEFEKNAYDYQIERINLETKQIQQQDKSMELKLKQIDTDHQAIQTEMEAVSKVIQKNIESTFKTFA